MGLSFWMGRAESRIKTGHRLIDARQGRLGGAWVAVGSAGTCWPGVALVSRGKRATTGGKRRQAGRCCLHQAQLPCGVGWERARSAQERARAQLGQGGRVLAVRSGLTWRGAGASRPPDPSMKAGPGLPHACKIARPCSLAALCVACSGSRSTWNEGKCEAGSPPTQGATGVLLIAFRGGWRQSGA